jgi:hypothetical protein
MSCKSVPRVPDRADYDPDYFESLLTEAEAARFLGYSVRALQNWRTRGGLDPESRGPRYIGRRRAVRYRRRDLIAWAEANLLEHSSQEASSAKAAEVTRASGAACGTRAKTRRT